MRNGGWHKAYLKVPGAHVISNGVVVRQHVKVAVAPPQMILHLLPRGEFQGFHAPRAQDHGTDCTALVLGPSTGQATRLSRGHYESGLAESIHV